MTTIVLGETTDHIIEIAPMIFNARILMTPKDAEGLYWDYGWCYRNIPEAVIAFTAWNPLTEDEPPGWHKRPGSDIRRAPHRPADAPVRCDHGKYDNCDYIGCEKWRRF